MLFAELLLAALSALGCHAHPADGPDIDVRIVIAPEKVTFTLLMNLAFVDEVVDSSREDEEAIHPVEYEAHKLDLLDHFRDTNRVTVDGVAVAPIARSFEVGEADLSLLPLFPRAGAKALIKLRLVLDYPAKTAPRTVGVVWGEFPPDRALETDLGTPPMIVVANLTAKGLRTRIEFGKGEPEYIWHDSGESVADRFEAVPAARPREQITVPLVSTLLLGLGVFGTVVGLWRRARSRAHDRRNRWLPFAAVGLLIAAALTTDLAPLTVDHPFAGPGLPDQADAIAIFEPLHANIYRAFDYVSESEIYDALERSVSGELLDRLYNEIYRSLIMQEEGGAVSEVQTVRPLRTEVESIGRLPPDDTPGFTVRTRWQVEGAVFHWGHSHRRTNEYEARYTVAQVDDGWRIRDHEILGQSLVETSTTDPRGR